MRLKNKRLERIIGAAPFALGSIDRNAVIRFISRKADSLFGGDRADSQPEVARQRLAFEPAQCMAAIITDADDAILSRTFEGIVTSWNPAAERMYGYSSEEILGKSSAVLIPEDRRDEADSVLARIHAGEHVGTFETARVRKDGTALIVSLTVSKIRDSEGSVIGASVIGRDLTGPRMKPPEPRRFMLPRLDSNE